MSAIAEVEQLLAATRKSLAIPPRNLYEAENSYTANVERLQRARVKLGGFSGDYVERLLRDMDELEKEANTMVLTRSNPVDALLRDMDELEKEANTMVLTRSNPVDALLAVDFNAEGAEGDVDEAAALEQEMEKKRDGKKKQSGRKTKSKKSQNKTENVGKGEWTSETPDPKPQDDVILPREEGKGEEKENAAEVKVVEEVTRYTECNSGEIPQDALGPGRCVLIPNTPLARLDFSSPVDYDSISCQCRVTLHRAVVTALTYGVPVPTTSNCVNTGSSSEPVKHSENVSRISDDAIRLEEGGGGEELPESMMEKHEEEMIAAELDEYAITAELSKQLVAEYDAILEEKEEEESSTKLIPADIPEKLRDSLRSFTFLPWVILICHGGYFAGGVFINGKPVVHKAFQRYVVRKKQGGKQSSNEKDGGSYGSIGSQIRRAQEIKWKTDVRDTLLNWSNYIHEAMIVLYVAPGPQNRAILTDFSGLPPIMTNRGERAVSPVSLKDPRVRKAPLTTHRPTFQEVQRIYRTVSVCTVEYVKNILELNI